MGSGFKTPFERQLLAFLVNKNIVMYTQLGHFFPITEGFLAPLFLLKCIKRQSRNKDVIFHRRNTFKWLTYGLFHFILLQKPHFMV